MKLGGFLFATLLLVRPAFGQTEPQDQSLARLRFQEGLAHARQNDLLAAIRAFEAAYATRPHFSVLYNIAQAQSSLGRNVEAATTFERYLTEAGNRIGDARREEVRALIESSRKRTGALKINAAAPDRTRIWLDGTELRPEQLQQPIPLSTGKHALLHSSGSGYPVIQEVTISAAAISEVQLPAPEGPAAAHSAQLGIACDVPGVSVTIDGETAGKTPLAGPLLVPSGTRLVGFWRPGYRRSQRSVVVQKDKLTSVACDLQLEAKLTPERAAPLLVKTTPKAASVLVDGQAFLGGTLPLGDHDLRVEHDGYLPYRKAISISAGKTQRYEIVLSPTPAKRERDDLASSRRKTLAYVLGGAGAALLLTGGGLFLWNQRRYDDWRTRQEQPGAGPDLKRVASIQRVDDLALGFVIFGTGLAAGGAWTFLTSGASDE